MPFDERGDENRFVEKYADSDFLQAVRALEIAGTAEVSDRVGCHPETARLRLSDLVERGQLEHRTIGGRNIYTITE